MRQFFRIVFGFLRLARRLFSSALFLVFILMLGLNVATLTMSMVHSLASQVIEATLGKQTIGSPTGVSKRNRQSHIEKLSSENRALKNELQQSRQKDAALRERVGKTTASVRTRTKKVAITNVSSTAGEAIPFWGIAVIVAATAYELDAACDTMHDMNDLELLLGMREAADPDTSVVCGTKIPTKEALWAAVKSSPGTAWASAINGLSHVKGAVETLPDTNFAKGWRTSISDWTGRWFSSE